MVVHIFPQTWQAAELCIAEPHGMAVAFQDQVTKSPEGRKNFRSAGARDVS